MNDPTQDQVVLWLQGGPGVSSLLGMMTEVGPYVFVGNNKELQKNTEYAWNKKANMLFFESPSGVGYSKDNVQKEYNDNKTAENNIKALVNWFNEFPEFKPNQFWIAGESYAGMYIPFLAEQILNHNNEQENDEDKINLQGFLIGNGVFVYDDMMLLNYTADQLAKHQFVSKELQDIFYSSCQVSMKSARCQYFYE